MAVDKELREEIRAEVRAEMQSQDEERERKREELAGHVHGQPLPYAETTRRGYDQNDAEREAKRAKEGDDQ